MAVKFDTQFSIYKVDCERSIRYFKTEKNIDIQNCDDLEANILSNICNDVKRKGRTEIVDFRYNNFNGVVFKTKHYPSWSGMIKNILEKSNIESINEIKIDLTNAHVSYVLSYRKNNNIFLLTGGLGSNYISEYTQKNYGLYLLPKIMKENTPGIKMVLENKLSGNRLSSKHSNRNGTTVNLENDMSLIFRELSLELDGDVIQLLGLKYDLKKIKTLSVDVKDSLVIKKAISIDDLEIVLDKMVVIEGLKDNFSLGYFVDIKKYGYSSNDINNLFINALVNKNYDNFILVGNDYMEYCIGGASYIIEDVNGNCILKKDTFITMSDIYEKCLPQKVTKSSVENILKCTLSVYDSDNKVILYPTKIKECIQGFVESDDKIPFLLFSGKWLMFDKNYIDILDIEYKKIYDDMTNVDKKLFDIIQNKNSKISEDSYNETFEKSDKVILTHKVLSNNIELADLICFDDNNLYLIHNKSKFQGSDVRDVFNQILVSAELINHYLIGKDKVKILEDYYDKIIKKYPNNLKIKSLTKEDFVLLFDRPNIHYIAGFMSNLSENVNSNYIKYLVLNTNKKLQEKNYDLLLLNVNQNLNNFDGKTII